MSNDFKVGDKVRLIEQDGDGYWDIEFGRVYEVTATPERVRAGGQP